jgi:hypothetical protein
MNPNKIDLDHHRIPDVVGQAIACLLERIEILENEAAKSMKPVQHHKSREPAAIYETSQEE